MKKLFALAISILMLTMTLLPTLAEDANTTTNAAVEAVDTGLDLLGSSVHYPQLTGLTDVDMQTRVNETIMASGAITERLNRMAMLISSPVKLNVSYTYALGDGVFSCAFLADGAVETTRATQVWNTVNLDLNTGEIIPIDALFTDVNAAHTLIDAYLNDRVAPELSAHLEAGAITPMSDMWSITEYGLTLHYPIDRYETLQGGAGTVTLLWSELREVLNLKNGSIPDRIGANKHLTLDETSAPRITESLASGTLMNIPATLGESVLTLIDTHGEATDPDLYEAGRLVVLDGGAFRQTWILTDALTEDFTSSIVQGIRSDRVNLHGLMTGVTTVDEWRNALGNPETTLAVDADRADAWRILPGTSDYYTLGDIRLRLHADENGVLTSIFINTNR